MKNGPKYWKKMPQEASSEEKDHLFVASFQMSPNKIFVYTLQPSFLVQDHLKKVLSIIYK